MAGASGVPRERIVGCPRSENFWQAGPIGPCGPCSELYLDRGLEFGAPEDLPGGENERFLEYWNLVFMQYDQDPHDTLQALPARNIDTGLGLNRMAAILQDGPSVFETDQFQPLIELGEELSGRRYGEDPAADRALRILADHARGDDVPGRRRRRALQRGPRLRAAPRDAPRDPAGRAPGHGRRASWCATPTVVRELMGGAYPELLEQRDGDRQVAGLRGGELRAHARAGHAAAGRADRSARGTPARRGSRRTTRSPCTTPTASRST